MSNNGVPLIEMRPRAADFVLSYEKKEFEGNTFFEVTAKHPASNEVPELVAHFFEEQAAKTCCMRYNLHEQLMKICLLAGAARARQRAYFSDRNQGALIASKQAEKELDMAIVAIQKM